MATRRPRKKAHLPEDLLVRLGSANPETRWQAAKALAHRGDRSTLVELERVALHDTESFQREGAFVDTTEYPFYAALEALSALYAELNPLPDDIARIRAHLEDTTLSVDRREALGGTLGRAARDACQPLTESADPALRLLAWNVIGWTERARSNHALWLEDEEVRLTAASQDAYRSGLVRDALARLPSEPSPRVRRALCDLWLRYRARMGGWLRSWELVDLLTDPDPAIHEKVARLVLDTAARSTPWIDDPGGLRETRDRLRALVEGARDPLAAPVLGEALALVERALAVFEPAP